MSQMLSMQLPKPWQPHNYQKKAIKFLLEHGAAGLLLDPGLGKTSISLAAVKILKSKKLINKVLVIAPVRVCYEVWAKEVEKWADFNKLKVVVLHGPKKNAALKEKADIYAVNFEGLDWLLQATKTKYQTKAGVLKTKVTVDRHRWKQLGFDLLIVDELTKFKHTTTSRFKTFKHVIGSFSRRWGLTGSISANGLMDLFGQCYVLDQGRTFGPYITHFRKTYFTPSFDGYSFDLKPGAEEQIYERAAPLMLRMSANDHLDMPSLVENNIYVELPEDAREIYAHMEKELIAFLDSGVVTASSAAVKSIKCRQIASGGIYLEPDITKLVKVKEKRKWANLHTAKVDAVADLVTELQGSPLLVAYDFEHDLDRLREKLNYDVPYIGGGVSMKRSSELCDLWNAGKLPVLFGHPQSIAHGLNLQEMGNHICWHTLTWNYELYDQLIRRILRQGNKSKRIFNHHILAQNTVDTIAVLPALRMKKNGQDAFYAALKNLKKLRK